MAWSVKGNIRGPQGPAGPTGATGPAGSSGVSGVTWKGAWSNGTAYAVNDVASWGGSSYVATAPHAANANQPPTGTTADPGTDDTAVNAGWAAFAVQGAQGSTGPTGATGPAGAQGPQGNTGSTGAAGARGSQWFTGTGAPGTVAGSLPGDLYLDVSTGDVYTLA